jgi:hypothetical protein
MWCHSVLEARVERRWRQASTAIDPPRRLVRLDGWSTEAWLARHAASPPHERRALTGPATRAIAINPHVPAANLLALRTHLVMDTGDV